MAMTDGMEVLREDFIVEAQEHLNSIEDDILSLENQGSHFDENTVNRLFRAMHSIKGSSSFLNLTNITELAHSLENVFSNIRNKVLIPNQVITETLLKGVDKLKFLLCDLENQNNFDISYELSQLNQLVMSPILNPEKNSVPEQEIIDHETNSSELNFKKPANKMTLTQTVEETQVVTKKETTSLSLENNQQFPYINYQYIISIDLAEECDNKNRLIIDLLKNIRVIGNFISGRLEGDNICSLKDEFTRPIIYQFKINSVIDDPDILASALDIKPLSVQQTELRNQFDLKKDFPESVLKKTPEIIQPPIETTNPALNNLPTDRQKPVPVQNENKLIPVKNIKNEAVSIEKKPLTQQFIPVRTEMNDHPDASTKKIESSTIRISLNLLDKLMNLTGELVLVRNQNIQAVESSDLQKIRTVSKKLNLVTSGLQACVLQTRMQTLDLVFSKFIRLVRDLSKKLGKEVNLEIIGKDVELDKNIVEALNEPLTHIIRNAVDHGIEMPDVREKLGKSKTGRLLLGAYHKEGHVDLKIQDDGKGMDPQNLIESALKKGIITTKEAEKYTEQDAFNLIFQPGFSTAKDVTDVSGRGVGMDVVKTSFQAIGGVIHLSSKPNYGTTIEVQLPLTMSIMHALIVMVEEICFAIPEYNIAEIVRLQGEDVYRKIETVNEQELYSLRGKLIPVIRLSRILKIHKTYHDPETNAKCEERRNDVSDQTIPDTRRTTNNLYILILKLGSLRYGLVVDTILDSEEIVVKTLHEQIKKCKVFIGTTVLGDGRIAMILDVASLAEAATFNIQKFESSIQEKRLGLEDQQMVLMFNVAGKETFAIPLFLISHIEKININDIMVAHNKEYYNYHTEIIQIIRLEHALESIEANYTDEVFIIIIKSIKPISIIVTQIIDITLINSKFDTSTIHKPGIIGGVMINGCLTLILDIFTIIERIEPLWISQSINLRNESKAILLIEDTKFYASLIISFLSGTGMKVVLAMNGQEGIEILEKDKFDIVISDIEMPVMNGLEFARYVRSQEKFNNLKLLAISASYNRDMGSDKALEAGFDRFIHKLDREALLDCLKKIASGEEV